MQHLSTPSASRNHAITLLYVKKDNNETDRKKVGVNCLRIVTNGGT